MREIEAATDNGFFHIEQGDAPLVTAAVHDGHKLRPEIEDLLALDEHQRLREEDPFTGGWTSIASTRIVGLRSRFEVDLNRPREGAVYVHPRDAWGLRVWKAEPHGEIVARSLAEYDLFYKAVNQLFENMQQRFGKFVVFDLQL